jgi:hypothetical protein
MRRAGSGRRTTRSTRRRWSAAVVSLVMGGTLALSVVPASATSTPKHWDARVEPIAKEVERLRGLRFKHPVPVVFTTRRQFRHRVAEQLQHNHVIRGAKAIYREEVVLRALGLLPDELSVPDVEGLDADILVAFYDPTKKEVVVRGHDIATGATLAHELTHTLQDQHFDLSGTLSRLHDTDAAQPFHALIEGDAMRVETEYVATLSAAQQEQVANGADGQVRTEYGVPWAAFALGGGPYTFGPNLVSALKIAGGERGIDAAFRTPPAHQVEVLNPVAGPASRFRIQVPEPKLREGDRRIGRPAPLGAMTLYVTLARRLAPTDALLAADDWTGSSAVAFIRDGRACVRAAVRTATVPGAQRLTGALRTWAGHVPAGASSVRLHGETVAFESCALGPGPAADRSPDLALTVPAVRNQLILYGLSRGSKPDLAACVADSLIADRQYLDVLDAIVSTGTRTPAQRVVQLERTQAITETCTSPAS